MLKKTAVIILILVTGIFYSCGIKKTASVNITENNQGLEYEEAAEPTRAELVMRALAQAYPDRIEKVEFRNDDWALLLRDTWYYFAAGRLLPENELENIDDYRPYQIYNYPAELPPGDIGV